MVSDGSTAEPRSPARIVCFVLLMLQLLCDPLAELTISGGWVRRKNVDFIHMKEMIDRILLEHDYSLK